MSIEDKALRDRAFNDPKVCQYLDQLTTDELHVDLGNPEVHAKYEEPIGRWKEGMDRPPLADADPAVNAAMGKCAVHRMRGQGMAVGAALADSFHPGPCGWCDYPLGQLLDALDWGLWHARFLVTEMLVWRQHQDAPGRYVTYVRPTGRSGYQHPAWAKFAALPQKEQARVTAALGQ